MSILNLLASQSGQKGNNANISLAKEITRLNNKIAVKELVDNLNNKNKNIQSDCIKTLYEIGYLKPELISDYFAEFIKLLSNKNNRLVWGSMIALATITDLKHEEIFACLDKITEKINTGSVITIDNGIEILAKLNKYKQYFSTTDVLLTEQLQRCPIKQLPMYIEKSMISINQSNKEIYKTIVEKRKNECEKETQIKRLNKLLKQITIK